MTTRTDGGRAAHDTYTSAGRLHTLLTALRSQPQTIAIVDAWASALGLPAGDRLTVLEGIARSGRLVREVRADIERLLPARQVA